MTAGWTIWEGASLPRATPLAPGRYALRHDIGPKELRRGRGIGAARHHLAARRQDGLHRRGIVEWLDTPPGRRPGFSTLPRGQQDGVWASAQNRGKRGQLVSALASGG